MNIFLDLYKYAFDALGVEQYILYYNIIASDVFHSDKILVLCKKKHLY